MKLRELAYLFLYNCWTISNEKEKVPGLVQNDHHSGTLNIQRSVAARIAVDRLHLVQGRKTTLFLWINFVIQSYFVSLRYGS